MLRRLGLEVLEKCKGWYNAAEQRRVLRGASWVSNYTTICLLPIATTSALLIVSLISGFVAALFGKGFSA